MKLIDAERIADLARKRRNMVRARHALQTGEMSTAPPISGHVRAMINNISAALATFEEEDAVLSVMADLGRVLSAKIEAMDADLKGLGVELSQ